MKYAAEQAIGLRRAGADVLVVSREHLQPMDEFDGNRQEWEGVIGRLNAEGVETLVIPGRTLSRSAAETTLRARSRLAAWRPDLVHAHPAHDPWLHLIASRYRLVLTIHDVVPHPGQPTGGVVQHALTKAWRTRADGFVVHGQALAQSLRPEVGGRPIAVVPHGVAPSPGPYPIPDRPSLLFFGRLEPYKGLPVLAKAMSEVWAQRPDVELVVAGRGPSAVDVPEHPRIHRLFRYIPEEEVDALLRASTLVVAPYTEASQSGVVALAVARGIPAIVSDQGSLPETAVDPSLVVPAGDPHALAEAVIRHLDHDESLRIRVHQMAIERLSWDAAAALTLRLYDELLDR